MKSEVAVSPLQRPVRRRLQKLTDTSSYKGVRIQVNEAVVGMGATTDVQMFRSGVHELTIEADVVVRGGLHLENASFLTLGNMTVRQYIDQRIDSAGPPKPKPLPVDLRANKCICPNGYPLAGKSVCPTKNTWGCEKCDKGYSEGALPWKDCYEAYKTLKSAKSGVYLVRLGGSTTAKAVKVYCDMGTVVGDTGGWTLVYKSGTTFNGGLNSKALNIDKLNSIDTSNGGAKFSDADINDWMLGQRVIRYVGEKSSSEQYLMYTQKKDFCGDNSPQCNKDTCPSGSKDLYPMLDGVQKPGSGALWKTKAWKKNGGIYDGHNNHGNCHGGMSSCNTGWVGSLGHVCLWLDKKTPGLWFNYGKFSAGRYPGTIWIRPAVKDGKTFNTYETASRDCYVIWVKDHKAPSGVYWIKKGGDGNPTRLYCDMGDLLGGPGGWTLVMKAGHVSFNQGLNTNEYNSKRLTDKVTGLDGKFSDADINKWLGTADQVLRYVGERSATEWYTFYTSRKDFCNDNSPNCKKTSCASGRYNLKGKTSKPGHLGGNGEAWKKAWSKTGGVYAGHNNHGNCHGDMSSCQSGWINNKNGAGHICTWNVATSPGLWFNYGPWVGGRYKGTVWVRPKISDGAETGWKLPAKHKVCTATEDCSCNFGTPSWAGCTSADPDGCATCDPGFTLTTDDKCTGNVCQCTGGVPKQGDINCPVNGVTKGCATCDGAYSVGPYANCYEAWLDLGRDAKSGDYWVRLGGNGKLVRVYCDMGDFYGDTGGWTLVYKSGTTFAAGLNAGAYNIGNLKTPTISGGGAKWHDNDINMWMTGKRIIRYIGKKDSNTNYVMYTARKDFCGDDSPKCSKITCPGGGDDLYPMMGGVETTAAKGDLWKSQNWLKKGGIYGGHGNHGNCHGGMTSCGSGWDSSLGHVCLWRGGTTPHIWFNYGPFTGGNYPGTIWVRPASGGDDDRARYNSENNPADDCYQIWKGDRSAKSGVYWVKKPSTQKAMRVYCDMGDEIGDTGGWTLVYKSGKDVAYNAGMNLNEYKLENIHIDSADISSKFSDTDINNFLKMKTGTGDRVLRYVGERDANQLYVMYTMKKDFCGGNAPSCTKKDCPTNGQRYPYKGGIENRQNPTGVVWKTYGDVDATGAGTNWWNIGGIYSGHNNHGNCHGAMSACHTGWINAPHKGHVCLWNGAGSPGLWFNYGDWVGGRYSGTVWARPSAGTPSQESGWDSNSVGGQCLPH